MSNYKLLSEELRNNHIYGEEGTKMGVLIQAIFRPIFCSFSYIYPTILDYPIPKEDSARIHIGFDLPHYPKIIERIIWNKIGISRYTLPCTQHNKHCLLPRIQAPITQLMSPIEFENMCIAALAGRYRLTMAGPYEARYNCDGEGSISDDEEEI